MARPVWAAAALAAALLLAGGCRGCGGGAPTRGAAAGQPPVDATAGPAKPAFVVTPASSPASAPTAPFGFGRKARQDPREALCRETVDALKFGSSLAGDQLAAVSEPPAASSTGSPRPRSELRTAVTCLAVAGDTDRGCDELGGDARDACARTVAYYRWARQPKGGMGWKCDALGQKKSSKKKLSAADHEAICAALRTRDASKCPAAGTEEGDGCRAEVSLDASYCRGREHCIEEVRRNQTITTGGLAARLPAAKGPEKDLVGAALKGAAACAPALEALRLACLNPGAEARLPGPAGTPAPQGAR